MTYYRYVSAGIESDAEFEELFTSVWKLEKMPPAIQTPVKQENKPAPEQKEIKVEVVAPVEENKVIISQGEEDQDEMMHTEILEYIKQTIRKGGVDTILAFRRDMHKADKNKTGLLEKAVLAEILSHTGSKLNQRNLAKLFRLFDTNSNDKILIKELCNTFIGELNEFRTGIVASLFKQIDKAGKGYIQTTDFTTSYDLSKHPDVISKKRTEKQILAMLLDQLELFFKIIVPLMSSLNFFRCKKKMK